MGRHRAGPPDDHERVVGPAERSTRPPSRPPSRRWPIVLVAMLAVVAIGWFGWSLIGKNSGQHAAAAGASCPAGPLAIRVAVAPDLAAPVAKAAAAYGLNHPVITDHCVTVQVSSIDPKQVAAGLTTSWDTTRLGPRPQAWIADSTLWTNLLTTQAPAALGDAAQSIGGSPVVLAMAPDAAKAVAAAGAPTWDAVPGIVGDPHGWARLGMPDQGAVTLALPDPRSDAASMLAVEAMVDPATPQGQPPITAGLLAANPAMGELAALRAGSPANPPASGQAALAALGQANGIATAPFSAVPVTELDLYERNVGSDGAGKPANVVDEVRASGPTPFADFPFVPLAGGGVTSDQLVAAQHFRDFLLTTGQQRALSLAGLREANSFDRPNPSPGMDWGSVSQAATPTDVASYQAVANAWRGPAG